MDVIRFIGWSLLAAFWLPTLLLAGPPAPAEERFAARSGAGPATLGPASPALTSPYLPSRVILEAPCVPSPERIGAATGAGVLPVAHAAPRLAPPSVPGILRAAEGSGWHLIARAAGQPRAPCGFRS